MKSYTCDYKFGIKEIILGLSILTPAFGNLKGILPINLYQVLILLLGIILLFEGNLKGKNRELYIPKWSIYMFIYIGIITFIFNITIFDFDSIKSFIITFLYILIFYNYVKRIYNIDKIFHLIYNIAFILSIIGIVQEIGYLLKIPELYDFSYIGITYNIPIGSSNAFGSLAKIQSIYSEPSHLALILGLGCSISFFCYINNDIFKFVSFKKSIIIFICSLLTFSTLIYIILMVCGTYILFFDKNLFAKKTLWWIVIIITLIFGIYYFREWLGNMFIKVQELFIKNNEDKYSAFAMTSNLKIAIEKIKDGYLFGTGLDSHRLLYFDYIDKIYKNVEIYLNYDEAASMYIRVLSEFGIIGLFTFLYYLFKELFLFKKKYRYRRSKLFYYQRAIILVLTVYLVRNGRYMDNLMFLCVFILYEINIRAKSIYDRSE